jgi:hypothetical protein
VRHLLERLLEWAVSGAWVEYVERMKAMKRERDGECVCNTGPDTDGPDEFCPWHGRPYPELVDRLTSQAAEIAQLREQLIDAHMNGLDAFRFYTRSESARPHPVLTPEDRARFNDDPREFVRQKLFGGES